jgi:hypothetical protein
MDSITLIGKIVFDPEDKTTKHVNQSSWKRIAMVEIGGDICAYYNHYIHKRYGFSLHRPLRGAHVTFINDRASEMDDKWDEVKKKWNGREVEITINLTPVTAVVSFNKDFNLWFEIPEENRGELHSIRSELGLGRPFFGLHLTIGRVVDYTEDKFEPGVMKAKSMNTDQAIYILNLIKNGLIPGTSTYKDKIYL